MSLDVPVLDAHVHLWDPRTTPRIVSPAVKLFGFSERVLHGLGSRLFPQRDLDFVGRTDHVLASFLPGHLRLDHASEDVRGFVHVEASWQARDPMRYAEETRWLEALCGPDLRAIVGHADLAHPRLDALLQAHRAASARFVGVRDKLAFSRDPKIARWTTSEDRMRDPAWRHGYARLGERGLTFDAWMYAPQLRDFETLVREVPGTRVVLDHLGTPIGLGGPEGARVAATWHEDLARLAQHRQVHAKISGLTMPIVGFGLHARLTPPSAGELADVLGPHVEHALRVFGVERCFFASNFPMDKVSVPWSTLYEAFAQLTSTRTQGERRALFHDNALRFYGVE
ncbi:amidohydrolase family protein [Sandaracinus amylolyticus]|uniref:amidohydrolase family protein n=1 Tax=Sandaracinus amylolyticus TaxID=927083 RepID=UPI001F478180|nr:amidohydrolase family protein [Sandaracinus amylolyticus]UJR87134.1 Hypothetical protein I5071_92350 [Sandaracinus amylolyticus]